MPLSGGRRLIRIQPLDAARGLERDGDPVDRVGRQGDDAARAEGRDGLGPAGIVVRARPGRSCRDVAHRAPAASAASRAGRLARRSPAVPGPAPRSSGPRPRRRAAERRTAPRPGPRPARSASRRHARPRPASRCRSTGRRSRAPRPSGTPSRRDSQRTARPFETPGATNSRKCGWLTVTSARPAKAARASGATSVGSGGSPAHMTLVTGWRDRRDEVVLEVRLGEPMNVVYSSARGSSDRTMNRSRWLRCGSSPCARVQTTTSRATSAGSGVWMSSRPGRVESAAGISRMRAPW